MRHNLNYQPSGNDEEAFVADGGVLNYYAYKAYHRSAGVPDSFEVATMGVQYLYQDPVALMGDPELFGFIVLRIRSVR